jgi:AraC-like DNA-binding protein
MDSTLLQESIGFRAIPSLSDAEVMDVEHSSREWRIFNTHYSLAVPSTWQGKATYRGRVHDVRAGMVFCSEPGETHIAAPTHRRGSFSVLMLDPTTLAACLADQNGAFARTAWRKAVHTMSGALEAMLTRILRSIGPHANPMQVQSDLVELASLLRAELLENPRGRPASFDADSRLAQRIRECLHQEGAAFDLETLSRKFGVSRFRVLRLFKQRYGVPPHAYQLCVRIASAQQLLKTGHAAADVAAECGFVDQSHMTRHFKRLLGLTPARYARGIGKGESKHGQIMPRRLGLLEKSDRTRHRV